MSKLPAWWVEGPQNVARNFHTQKVKGRREAQTSDAPYTRIV